MTFSPTALRLTKGIKSSGLTYREIADRLGLKHANTLEMMSEGLTQVPLSMIPALAQTLNMDERYFLMLALQEYFPGVHEVLVDVLGLSMKDAEIGILTMFRLADIRGNPEVEPAFLKALEALLELAAFKQVHQGVQ